MSLKLLGTGITITPAPYKACKRMMMMMMILVMKMIVAQRIPPLFSYNSGCQPLTATGTKIHETRCLGRRLGSASDSKDHQGTLTLLSLSLVEKERRKSGGKNRDVRRGASSSRATVDWNSWNVIGLRLWWSRTMSALREDINSKVTSDNFCSPYLQWMTSLSQSWQLPS